MKFYPADWRSDPALRVCSIGARGLWMEMLCLMHEAEPRGSLLIAGKPVTEAQLASLVGVLGKVVGTLLSELEEANVFSRDESGTIFSRRMRRDIAKAERDKANGKTGGNPNLKQGVNPHDGGAVNPEDNGGHKAQKPEARNQTSLREDARRARAAFGSEFWPRYPNKVGKPAAERAFEKARRSLGGSIEPIIAGLERYIRDKPVDRPWLNPATFLNQRRFEDEPASPNGTAKPPASGPRVDFGGGVCWPETTVLQTIDRWREDPGSWPTSPLGPPPGKPGCRVPNRLLNAAQAPAARVVSKANGAAAH